jgi:hypothetical protein
LLSILPYDRGGWPEANADGAALVDEGTFGGDPPDDIFGRQYNAILPPLQRHPKVRC